MKRFSTPLANCLTYILFVPLLFCLVGSTGLVVTMALTKLAGKPASSARTQAASAGEITHLPTLTPTPSAVSAAQLPGQPDAVTTGPNVIPSSAPNSSPAVPTPGLPGSPAPAEAAADQNQAEVPSSPDPASLETSGVPGGSWSFVGVQSSTVEDKTILLGVLINNTGTPQQAVEVSGTFYNNEGQVIPEPLDISSYIPVDIIPIGAHVPFEVDVKSSQPIARFELLAQAEPATLTPRQDFQFAEVNHWIDDDGMYCLGGQVHNIGGPLQDHLVILATIYNDQGRLVSYTDDSPASSEVLQGGQTSPFQTCLDPLDQRVTRYELNALGY